MIRISQWQRSRKIKASVTGADHSQVNYEAVIVIASEALRVIRGGFTISDGKKIKKRKTKKKY